MAIHLTGRTPSRAPNAPLRAGGPRSEAALDNQAQQRPSPNVNADPHPNEPLFMRVPMLFQANRCAPTRDSAPIFTADHRRDSRSAIDEHSNVKLSMPMVARRQTRWVAIMQKHMPSTVNIRPTNADTADAGKVRLGGESPSFGPVRAAPANTADAGKVRLGGESPSFGPTRASAR
jgi:hypothetical protein